MTIITTITEYLPFDEYDDNTQNIILEKHRDINTDYEWWDNTVDYFVEILNMVGWSNVQVYFSGFNQQGSGAQFTGRYTFEGKQYAKIKKEYPEWAALQDFIRDLEQGALDNNRNLHVKIESSGRYSHENCTDFYLESENPYGDIQSESEIVECCKRFMREIYSTLEDEYDYLISDKTIIERFESNGYEFDKNGNIL